MIVIKSNKVEVNDSLLSDFQKQFKEGHYFVCAQLLDQSLKSFIDDKFSTAKFSENTHKTKRNEIIAQEFAISSNNALPRILNFYFNRKDVLDAIRKISGVSAIKSFNGRVYRFDADNYSYDSWHSDMDHGRLLGLSLNLSDSKFEGGEFTIRNATSKKVYKTIKHNDWGSAHFFRISDQLEHKVEKVSGEHPRIAFAGWFNSEPLFNELK